VSISLPGLARFGCDLSATVGGIPDFGPAFRSRGSGHKNTREKRGPNGCGHRRAAGWCYFARGLAWVFINQPRSLGWIHGLDRHLRRLTIGAFAGTRNPATRNRPTIQVSCGRCYPRMGIRTTISNASSCVALWQQPGGGEYRIRRTDRYIRLSDNYFLGYFLGALGRRRCRKRTPGPPPFSSMNSTPAASKVRRTAKSLAVVIDVSSSVSSARLIVVTLRAVSRARSSALQRMRARAALI
jgi:hypothetical protein